MTNSLWLNVGCCFDQNAKLHKKVLKQDALRITKDRVVDLGYTWEEFTTPCRKRELTDLRKVVANYLYKRHMTYKEIGGHLNIDHSTVVYHKRTFEEMIPFDIDLQKLNYQFNKL